MNYRLTLEQMDVVLKSTKAKEFTLKLIEEDKFALFFSSALEIFANEGNFSIQEENPEFAKVVKVLDYQNGSLNKVQGDLVSLNESQTEIMDMIKQLNNTLQNVQINNLEASASIAEEDIEIIPPKEYDPFDEEDFEADEEEAEYADISPEEIMRRNIMLSGG